MSNLVYEQRITQVMDRMEQAGLSQLLVSDPGSIFYLTGIAVEPFERFWAFLLRKDGTHTLFANRLFALEHTEWDTVTMTDTENAALVAAPYIRPGKLGVDKNLPARFLLPILDAVPGAVAVLGSDCVDQTRARKDETEQDLMREASRMNDQCMEQLMVFLREGVTERECAAFVLEQYRKLGANGLSFEPIVAFGANAADPHHTPDDTTLKDGDCIVADIGCKYRGYCSDMTRTFFWKQADSKHSSLYRLVQEANQKAEALIRPGIRLHQLDDTAREHIASAGFGAYFTHRLGHFIGIEDHEKGDVSATNQELIQPGMVFSIEPGVYLPGEFGVRIEDLVLVTETGCEILNHVSKDLCILGTQEGPQR